MKIEINLKTGFSEKYDELIPFQGDLKSFTNHEDRESLKKSIIEHGIIYPTFVWEYENVKYIWDGHGRQEIYKELHEYGYELPELPVVYINAKNRADAKIKLLKKEQDYGRRVNRDSLSNFLKNEDINTDLLLNLKLPEMGKIDTEFLNDILKTETIKEDDQPSQTGEARETKNTNKEINTETFGEGLTHSCPKCGFDFNG